ncbi:recombinase family protein [Robiginitalea marina]|uniref:Recombinase family protein n=1 Tax=Robiginitalea marina TaxID=2954105 RepID=A0ABT1AU84_9FLAO|nr:recombinase family protein [Robiginitalea marina]MCO5723224.1 recombinase family protein [Robiginitalea marina]
MKAKYIRVSTTEQNTHRQEEKGVNQFIDKCSGSIPFKERPSAKRLLTAIDKGQINEVQVKSIDRLGRNTLDILTTIRELTDKNIAVVSQKEGLTTIIDGKVNPVANLIISIMATLSEFELEQIRERQREGIERAKQRGVYSSNGGSKKLNPEQFLSKSKNALCAKHLKNGESVRRAAKLSGVSNATALKVKKHLSVL